MQVWQVSVHATRTCQTRQGQHPPDKGLQWIPQLKNGVQDGILRQIGLLSVHT